MTDAQPFMDEAGKTLDLILCNVPEAGDVRQASIADIASALSVAYQRGREESRAEMERLRWSDKG